MADLCDLVSFIYPRKHIGKSLSTRGRHFSVTRVMVANSCPEVLSSMGGVHCTASKPILYIRDIETRFSAADGFFAANGSCSSRCLPRLFL